MTSDRGVDRYATRKLNVLRLRAAGLQGRLAIYARSDNWQENGSAPPDRWQYPYAWQAARGRTLHSDRGF